MIAIPVVFRTPKRVFIPFALAAVWLGWDCLMGWMLTPLLFALVLLFRAGLSCSDEDPITFWDGAFLAVCGWQVLLTCRLGVAIIEGVSPFASFEWLSRAAMDCPARMIPLLLLPALAIHGLLHLLVQRFHACRTGYALDLMPSLQMEVDDELVCGQCYPQRARWRRKKIEREQDLLEIAVLYTRVLLALNGLAVGAALICLLAGVAWRCLGGGSSIESALVICAPTAIGLALILPVSNLLLGLAIGWNLSLRATWMERWENFPVPPSKRSPWLWYLVGLLGWCDLEGLILALLGLCGLLLMLHLAQPDLENPLSAPFPHTWHRAAALVHVWQGIFVCCSTLAIGFSTSQAQILESLGGMVVDNNPRLLPLLWVPLLLAYLRIHDQAWRIGCWSDRFRNDDVPGILMVIEMNRWNGSQSHWQATTLKQRLEQEATLLDWVAILVSRTRRLGQLSLLATSACLIGGAAWRCTVLGQDTASACWECVVPLTAFALILTTSSLLFTTALELRLASPFRYLKRSSLFVPLAEHHEVQKVVGGVLAEIGLAWLGLPWGLYLAAHTLWRCRFRFLPLHGPIV